VRAHGVAQARGPVCMCMCLGLRLWVGVNVAVILVVGVEVWVRCRRWLMVGLLIRRLWVVRVVVRHDWRRVWLWRREGRTVMSAATAAIATTARCARVMPVVERGCRSGHWIRTRVRGRRWTFLHVGRGMCQDLDLWRKSGRGKEEALTGARMLPRARRRPCTWASRWASFSIEDGEEWSGTFCDWWSRGRQRRG
jgi:hypothetical protein